MLPDGEPGFGFNLERAQETDLPVASRIAYIDADADYRQADRGSAPPHRRIPIASRSRDLPLVLDQGQAIGIGARLLMDAWTMRESASFALRAIALALDPTDEVLLDAGGRTRRLRLTEIDDAGAREDSGGRDRSVDLRVHHRPVARARRRTGPCRNSAAHWSCSSICRCSPATRSRGRRMSRPSRAHGPARCWC